MIKLVAFDWNGTLIADTWPLLEGVNKVLKTFSRKPISHKQFLEDFDVPVSIAYKRHGLDPDLIEDGPNKISQIFHPFYEERVNRIRTRTNTKKVLKYLKEKSLRSIIFSNHTQYGVSRQLKRLNIEHYFETVLTNSEKHTALLERSKKEKLNSFMRTKKLLPKETLIVGDTIEEIQIARSLGSIVCSITHGNCSTRRLKAAKPDYLIGNLKELIPIVTKLNQNN